MPLLLEPRSKEADMLDSDNLYTILVHGPWNAQNIGKLNPFGIPSKQCWQTQKQQKNKKYMSKITLDKSSFGVEEQSNNYDES